MYFFTKPRTVDISNFLQWWTDCKRLITTLVTGNYNPTLQILESTEFKCIPWLSKELIRHEDTSDSHTLLPPWQYKISIYYQSPSLTAN